VKIVELGSMTRAAELLHVAQPALGLQIRQLEQELGVTLLQRHSRGVVATQAGQRLYERALDVLERVEQARREVAACGAGAVETITLGLTPSLMQLLATDLLVRVRAEIAGLALHLVEELSFVLLDMLARRDLDLTLAYDVPATPGLDRTPWLTEELLLVTPPAHDATRDASGLSGRMGFAAALGRELVMAGRRDMVRRIVDAAAERAGLTARIAFEVQSVQAMKILVADGLGGTIMPYGTVLPELRAGTLAGYRIADARLERTLYLVRPEKRAPGAQEERLLALLDRMRDRLFTQLGPLARPV
jgi:LysR family transcriptional regulator, nitrogen assimilation regulatory protein